MKKYDVVGIGGCLVDYFAKVPKIIGPEEKINVDGVHIEAGGPTANNLVQIARLGLHSAWLGKIGDDDNGQIILDSFMSNGVETEAIEIVKNSQSAYTWIPVDNHGERCIYIFSNITKTLNEQDVYEKFSKYIINSKAINTEICQIPLKPIIAALRIAKNANVTTMLDLDVDIDIFIKESKLGTEEELFQIINLTDVLKASENVLMNWTGFTKVQDSIIDIMNRGPKIVAVTNGKKGSIISDKNNCFEVPAFNVNVIDSTGAGDAYMGGLSFGVLHGWTLDKIGQFANACGAICCTKFGAQQMATISEIENFIANH